MNEDIKAAWINALRSGEYRQGYESLKQPETNSYCCLGVLCELAPVSISKPSDMGYDGSQDVLPDSIVIWAGLDIENPLIPFDHPEEDDTTYLAKLNDIYKLSFNELADLIEEHL